MSERYTIKGKIGQGGVGAVYLAFDNSLKRDVAIKRLLTQDDEPGNAELLVKEAGMLSKLQHPNIVTVYDVGIDDDGGYVVMELIQGETFDVTIARGALTSNDFAQVVDHTLEAMIAAQQIGMLHRDLKPSNIMVSWLPSGRFQVKVLDFGLAKLSQTPALQTINHGDAIMGSIYFMAPEQFDRELLDARTDLYSLGCLYYYGLTGNYPFDGEQAPNVMIAHIEHDVKPLGELRPDLPQEVCDWVMRLISKEKEDRPNSASEAAAEFKPVLAAIKRAENPMLDTAEIPVVVDQAPSPNRPTLITGPVKKRPPLHTTGYQVGSQLQKKSPAGAIILWLLAAIAVGACAWFLLENKEKAPAVTGSATTTPQPDRENPPAAETPSLPQRLSPNYKPLKIIKKDTFWSYWDKGELPNEWMREWFNDSTWLKGRSPLGFGDPTTTKLKPVDDISNRPITYYFRKKIDVENMPKSGAAFRLEASILYDDAFRMFINEAEVLRAGLPEGKIDTNTLATTTIFEERETIYTKFELNPTILKDGTNVIAVEVHQAERNSSDLHFSMQLEFVKK